MKTAPLERQQVIRMACELIEKWTGFTLRETTPHRISETFSRRAARLGYDDPRAYLEALRDLPPTAEEPQQLVNLITNGLTAFWRDEPQLSALRSILGHIHATLPTDTPVRVWCAGVSTGEEAYTVAMIADEESIPVDVLGTDVNTDFLDTARRRVYSNWSLRRLSAERQQTYLTPLDANNWKLDHPVFDSVRFDHHNLLQSPPTSGNNDGRWDIVLCRNVLIYFASASTTRALQHLANSLSENGYLMFGSSEQIHPERLGPDAPSLRPIRQGGGFLYRPGPTRTGRTIEPGQWYVDPPEELPRLSAPRSGLEETTSDVGDNSTVVDLLHTAVNHLNDGDLELAAACLEASLGYDPFRVESHCLMGITLQSLGATHQAQEAFQKALFLEPNHWFASHRTASFLENSGDINAARRAFRNTLESLGRPYDPLDTSHLLRSVVGAVQPLRHHAQRQSEDFLRTHGLQSD